MLHRLGGADGTNYIRSIVVVLGDERQEPDARDYWISSTNLRPLHMSRTEAKTSLVFVSQSAPSEVARIIDVLQDCRPSARIEVEMTQIVFQFPSTEKTMDTVVSFLRALYYEQLRNLNYCNVSTFSLEAGNDGGRKCV